MPPNGRVGRHTLVVGLAIFIATAAASLSCLRLRPRARHQHAAGAAAQDDASSPSASAPSAFAMLVETAVSPSLQNLHALPTLEPFVHTSRTAVRHWPDTRSTPPAPACELSLPSPAARRASPPASATAAVAGIRSRRGRIPLVRLAATTGSTPTAPMPAGRLAGSGRLQARTLLPCASRLRLRPATARGWLPFRMPRSAPERPSPPALRRSGHLSSNGTTAPAPSPFACSVSRPRIPPPRSSTAPTSWPALPSSRPALPFAPPCLSGTAPRLCPATPRASTTRTMLVAGSPPGPAAGSDRSPTARAGSGSDPAGSRSSATSTASDPPPPPARAPGRLAARRPRQLGHGPPPLRAGSPLAGPASSATGLLRSGPARRSPAPPPRPRASSAPRRLAATPHPAPAESSPAVWPRPADYEPSGHARPPLRAPTAYRLPRGFPHPAPDPSFRHPAGFGQASCLFRSGSPSPCRLPAYARGARSSSLRAAPDPAAPVRLRLRPAASLRPWPASTALRRLRPPARPRASVRLARVVVRPSRPASPQPPCGLAPTTSRRLRPCPGLPRRLPGRSASAGRPAPPWPAPAALADSLLQPTSTRAAGLPLQ
nr:nascent polypeptide-associated complex subunit alpha, muscle-specific form-like [Aegilops tauschii subsp. strangulata]